MGQSFRLFHFLFRSKPAVVLGMTAAGALSGLLSVGVVALITRTLHHGAQASGGLALAFLVLIAAKIATAMSAQLLLTRFTQGTILELSLSLAKRILDAPLRVLEQRGGAKILATLTDDVSSVTWAVQCIPKLAVNTAVVFGCAAYLAWLSWQLFLFACVAIALGALVFAILHRRAFKVIHAARDARSRLFEHFRALTSGLKELKMHRARRHEFVETDLRSAADAFRQSNLEATRHYATADAFAQLLLYGVIALLLFASPLVATPSAEVLTGYVLTLLYMMSPLWTIIDTAPAVARGQAALAMIDDLGVSLETPLNGDSGANVLPARPSGHVDIEMRDVVFTYEGASDRDRPFSLGPVDFRLRSGEVVFVVGGNGSGKSTFVKLLAGLYSPQGGEILLNGRLVDGQNKEWYREHFSIVFADFFLFQKLFGLSPPGLTEAAHEYLKLLQMDGKVRLQDRVLSSTDLSQGQRKRLALLTAYLEDRPVYVFDEWAADQDPEYKEIFYSQLLPDLRTRGKAVVVITHDDRYFNLGDRVIRLDDGHVAGALTPARDSSRRTAVIGA